MENEEMKYFKEEIFGFLSNRRVNSEWFEWTPEDCFELARLIDNSALDMITNKDKLLMELEKENRELKTSLFLQTKMQRFI